MIINCEPDLAANSSAILTISSSGCNSFGATIRMFAPKIAPVTSKEFAMLLRPSPQYATVIPSTVPKFSWIVKKSAIICVGCHSSVKPFHTGTPENSASSSTIFWLKPRNSIPSNIRPNTLAVSSVDSFLPNWISLAPRYSGCAPKSIAAVVKAARVRVDVFSNKSAMFLPSK